MFIPRGSKPVNLIPETVEMIKSCNVRRHIFRANLPTQMQIESTEIKIYLFKIYFLEEMFSLGSLSILIAIITTIKSIFVTIIKQ